MKSSKTNLFRIGGSWFFKIPSEIILDSSFPVSVERITKNVYLKNDEEWEVRIEKDSIVLKYIKK
jgi:hypothetical protein